MNDSITIVRNELDNNAGIEFTAVSDGSHVGHCRVFFGGAGIVYSHVIAQALAESGVIVRTEYCIFDADIKDEEAGTKLIRSVQSFAQSAGAGVVTIGLIKEAFDEFFPESEDTRRLRSVLSAEGFNEVPGSQGQAMYFEAIAEAAEPKDVRAIEPTVIRHPGDREYFAASMRQTAQELERWLESADQALLEQGYTVEDIQSHRQHALTARRWADFHTSPTGE
jgi:hypothetical protein|tara:strand:- start:561 stop:1229 length:669 start_codon:yes stop_codon:yes gene_type:complete